MITLSTICIIIAIVTNYVVYKESKNADISFNPLEFGFILWLTWFFSNIIAAAVIISTCLTYLP